MLAKRLRELKKKKNKKERENEMQWKERKKERKKIEKNRYSKVADKENWQKNTPQHAHIKCPSLPVTTHQHRLSEHE